MPTTTEGRALPSHFEEAVTYLLDTLTPEERHALVSAPMISHWVKMTPDLFRVAHERLKLYKGGNDALLENLPADRPDLLWSEGFEWIAGEPIVADPGAASLNILSEARKRALHGT